jgi:hypothetical protein
VVEDFLKQRVFDTALGARNGEIVEDTGNAKRGSQSIRSAVSSIERNWTSTCHLKSRTRFF